LAAIDHDRLSGHSAGEVAGEKERNLGDVLGPVSIDRLLRIQTKLGCKVDLKVTAPRRLGALGRMTIRAA